MCKPHVAVALGGNGELGAQRPLARIHAPRLHHLPALGVHRAPHDLGAVAVQRDRLRAQQTPSEAAGTPCQTSCEVLQTHPRNGRGQ